MLTYTNHTLFNTREQAVAELDLEVKRSIEYGDEVLDTVITEESYKTTRREQDGTPVELTVTGYRIAMSYIPCDEFDA